MSFPLQVGTKVVADPASLAALVQEDSGVDSGTVVAGKRPWEWVAGLVDSGALERRLGVGLAAALIQHPDPATTCEGARLSRTLVEPALGRLLLRALAAHDTALLLRVDPGHPGASVEDTLLRCAAVTVALSDDEMRRDLLQRLRNAGLPELEIPILCGHGDVDDLRLWLPAVLAEGLEPEDVAHLAQRMAQGDDGAKVMAEALDDVDPELRARVAHAASIIAATAPTCGPG